MKISGLQKLTLIDYPGKLAATVFSLGCNFRCPFCYSSELVMPEKIKNQPEFSQEEFFKFLKERQGLLEGVVLCGGEPTIQKDLPEFAKKIKKMGYLVKLDTNGSNPEMMARLIKKNLLDYVAIDIKAPKEKYSKVSGKKADIKKIEESINILKNSEIDFEFRTTVVPKLLNKDDIIKIAKWLQTYASVPRCKGYFLQNFLPEKTLDPKFEKIKPYPEKYILEIQKAVAPFFQTCQVR